MDHSTILHGIARAEDIMFTDSSWRVTYEKIRQEFLVIKAKGI